MRVGGRRWPRDEDRDHHDEHDRRECERDRQHRVEQHEQGADGDGGVDDPVGVVAPQVAGRPFDRQHESLAWFLQGPAEKHEAVLAPGLLPPDGLTREEIQEVFYSAIPYCGFPIANTAKAAMLAAFKDLDEAAAK